MSFNPQFLSHEWSTLCKCVAFANLTSASQHVGISQPQLSRILKKLEDQLGIELLDRLSPRTSCWTPAARTLVNLLQRSNLFLTSEVQRELGLAKELTLRVACLEGLAEFVAQFCALWLRQNNSTKLELLVLDISDLERLFLEGQCDLIFSSRAPTKRKFNYERIIGYQNAPGLNRGRVTLLVATPFEWEREEKSKIDAATKTILTNSLAVKRHLIEEEMAFGRLYSNKVGKKAQAEHALPVYALAKDTLPRSIWVGIEKIIAQTMHESEKTNSSSLKAKQRKTPALKE